MTFVLAGKVEGLQKNIPVLLSPVKPFLPTPINSFGQGLATLDSSTCGRQGMKGFFLQTEPVILLSVTNNQPGGKGIEKRKEQGNKS